MRWTVFRGPGQTDEPGPHLRKILPWLSVRMKAGPPRSALSRSSMSMTLVEVVDRSTSRARRSRVFIDDWQSFEPPAIGGGIEEEVVTLYVVENIGLPSSAPVSAISDPASFPGFWAMREAILTREPKYPLGG